MSKVQKLCILLKVPSTYMGLSIPTNSYSVSMQIEKERVHPRGISWVWFRVFPARIRSGREPHCKKKRCSTKPSKNGSVELKNVQNVFLFPNILKSRVFKFHETFFGFDFGHTIETMFGEIPF